MLLQLTDLSAQLTSSDGYIYLRNQIIYGNNSAVLTYTSNHSNISMLRLANKNGTRLGDLYGAEASGNFGLLDGDGNWSILTSKDNYTAFRINNSEKLRIKSDGNVGIGTTSPQNMLHVSAGGGSVVGIKVDGRIRCNSANGGMWLSNTNNGFVGTNGDNVGFWTSGQGWKAFQINESTGNIGIGTLNPGAYKLAVNGNIRAKEIIVESGWSDYVFYDDYKLPSLEEEEKHIEEQGHLLGFESEKDMDGKIQLADVSKKQQAKIEEMMLHLIEINKQLNKLETENESLQNQVESLQK